MVKLPWKSKQGIGVKSVSISFQLEMAVAIFSLCRLKTRRKYSERWFLADRCELFLEWRNELTGTFASNLEWSNDNRWVHTSDVSRQSLAGAQVHLRA